MKTFEGARTLLYGGDPPPPEAGATHRVVASAAALYLAYAGATYLDLKSGLPLILCVAGGAALASPFILIVTRPLLAWRVAWITAVVTGLAVQAHHRTPFSWHPALLAAQVVILVVIAWRLPFAVTAWAFVSMVALISLSFYPADWLPLSIIVAVVLGLTSLVRRARHHARRAVASGPGPGR